MNGKNFVNFLTPVPGNTATSASYVLGLTHFTCGNKKMCVNNANEFPIASNLDIQVIGVPQALQNGVACCNVRVVCDVTYEQIFGCSCCQNSCLQTEKVVAIVPVPLTSADVIPTISDSAVSAEAVNTSCGCSSTNEVSLRVSFTLETTANANG